MGVEAHLLALLRGLVETPAFSGPRESPMLFSLFHETLYRYAAPIWLGTHVIRLNPRLERARVISRSLVIEPIPVALRDVTDAYGNLVTQADFSGACNQLRIVSQFELEQADYPPPGAMGVPPLPWPPNGDEAAYLPDTAIDPAVGAYAARIAAEVGSNAPAFLDRLTQRLYADFDHHIRDVGHAYAPAETLALGKGACRDLTLLFLACCRSLGVPARFVSGYQSQADTPDGRRHLHAWPEALLPGVGWRGYDPTHGVTVADGHVALCVAPVQAATMPVEGGYFGPAVESTLTYDIRIATRKG